MTDIANIYEIDGIELMTDIADRRVGWCSAWERIHTLNLDRREGGPGTCGHVDYFVPARLVPSRTISTSNVDYAERG